MSALWYRRGAERLPASIALALIPSLPRPHLERLVQSLIDRMDEADGDTDLEPNGDEEDGSHAEDDFWQAPNDEGAGCPISDPCGMQDEDEHNTGEAFVAMHGVRYDGPGCPIADYTLDQCEGGIS